MRNRGLGLMGAALLALAAAGGCSRPSEAKCKQAVDNIQALTDTDKTATMDPHAAVRSCRANASEDAVDCMIAAKTREDLLKCEGSAAKEMTGEPAAGGK